MIRVGVIGAGAVAEQGYLPALAELPDATVTAVVDAAAERAREMASTYGADTYATDHRAVLDAIDGAIVATPPAFHAEIAGDCLEAGVHVLTEKPVATDVEAAEALVALAEDRGRHFAISRQQRDAPAVRAVRSVVETGGVGEPTSFVARYGDRTEWAFASDYRVRSELSWGGALTDKGPHVLDVIAWLFRDRDLTVGRYADDDLGGLEANAVLELIDPDRPLSGSVEITASRAIPNELTVVGTTATVSADPNGEDATVTDHVTGERTRITVDGDGHLVDYRARIANQTRRFVAALDGDPPSYVSAATGVAVIEWIEACYADRDRLVEPWERRHLDVAMEERIDG